MNFVIISPYFPTNFQQFARALHEKGVNVLGIGSEPYAQLGPALQHYLTEYYRVDDLEDTVAVKKGVAHFFAKYGPIDRVESHNEHWLDLDAALREQFNIPGLRPADLEQVKYKSEMKKLFKQEKVPVVDGMVVHSAKEVDRAVKKLKLPLIAKPDNGVGAAATYKLLNKKDVEEFKKYYDGTVPYFLEQLIQSDQLLSYDGLIDQEGNIVYDISLEYNIPTLDMFDGTSDAAYIIAKEVSDKLREYGQRIVKAFGMKERFFHIEFFKMPNGDYVALEYNNRIAGSKAVDLYNCVHSIDFFSAYASVVLGEEKITGFEQCQPMYGAGISRRYRTLYQHSFDEIRDKYHDQMKFDEPLPEVFSDIMGDHMFCLVTDTKEEAQEAIDYCHAKVK